MRCPQRTTEDINWTANVEVLGVQQCTFIHPKSHGKRGRNEISYKKRKQQGREERTEVLFCWFLRKRNKKKKRLLFRFATNIRIRGSNLMCKPLSYFRKKYIYNLKSKIFLNLSQICFQFDMQISFLIHIKWSSSVNGKSPS